MPAAIMAVLLMMVPPLLWDLLISCNITLSVVTVIPRCIERQSQLAIGARVWTGRFVGCAGAIAQSAPVGLRGGRLDLLLLDTAGYPLRDARRQRSLHDGLRQYTGVDVHLTLNATSPPEDIVRGYDAFAASATSQIFTRLDEATAPGSLLDDSLRRGLPITYVTTGQRPVQDLSPTGPDELTMLALGGVEVEPAFA